MELLEHEINLIKLLEDAIDKEEVFDNKLKLIEKILEFQTKLLDHEKSLLIHEKEIKGLEIQDEKNIDEYCLRKKELRRS